MTASDQVLWTAYDMGGDHNVRHVFRWENGKISDLGAPAGLLIDSMAINSKGQAIWTSQDGSGLVMHGFLWQRGKLTNLGTLNGMSIAVSAINDRGQIVGTNAPASKPYNKQHAFIWQNGTMTQPGSTDLVGGGPSGRGVRMTS